MSKAKPENRGWTGEAGVEGGEGRAGRVMVEECHGAGLGGRGWRRGQWKRGGREEREIGERGVAEAMRGDERRGGELKTEEEWGG